MAATFSGDGILQFENANSLRSYPFAEDTELVSTDGRTPPEGAIVDMHLMVPVGGGLKAELASLHLSRSMVSACVRIVADGSTRGALSVAVGADNFKPYTPFRLEKLAGTEDMGGIITFGDIELPHTPETYFFSDVEVHQGCITGFDPPRLRSIFDPRSGESARGDVRIVFSGYVDAKRDGRSVKLVLGADGGELSSRCARELPLNGCGAEPIMSINNVRPDSEGRIVLWFH